MTPQQILEKISSEITIADETKLSSLLSDLINRIEKLEDRMNGVIRPDGSGSIAFVEEKKDEN